MAQHKIANYLRFDDITKKIEIETSPAVWKEVELLSPYRVIVTSVVTIILTDVDSSIILTGNNENQVINLGNATTFEVGKSFYIQSDNTEVISIVNSSLVELLRLEPNCKAEFILIDNTTVSGLWKSNVIYPSADRCTQFTDDFIAPTTAGQTNWASATSGAGSSIIVSAIQDKVGVVRLNTGTTTTGRAIYNKGNSSFLFGGGVTVIEKYIRIPNLSTVTDEYILSIGTGDNIASGDHTDGIYFEYNRLASGDFWRVKTSNASIRTTTITTQPVLENTWIKLKFEVNATATAAKFFVNDVFVGTATGNIPTSSSPSRASDLIVKIEKTSGITPRLLEVDYSHIRLYRNR